jgi:hypothetical protein
MANKNIDNPQHWRDRAAEMRAITEWMKNPETIVIMAKLADYYDKLADEAETRGKGTPKTH